VFNVPLVQPANVPHEDSFELLVIKIRRVIRQYVAEIRHVGQLRAPTRYPRGDRIRLVYIEFAVFFPRDVGKDCRSRRVGLDLGHVDEPSQDNALVVAERSNARERAASAALQRREDAGVQLIRHERWRIHRAGSVVAEKE
jgi:hypothetical protein